MSANKMGRNPFQKQIRSTGIAVKSKVATRALSGKRSGRLVRKPGKVRWILSTTFIRVPVFSLVCAFKLGSLARGLIFRSHS
jgi:hypothetical protein